MAIGLAMTRFASLGLVVCSVLGCASGTVVGARVLRPAVVPLRAFPRVWVTRGHLLEEVTLSEALGAHLTELGGVEVSFVDLDSLEPARTAGRIPPATIVVITQIDFHESTDSRWTSRPETVCGSAGCYAGRRTYVYDVPTLRAVLTLTVHDGPTAQLRQRLRLKADEEGRDYDVMRHRATAALVDRLLPLVDQRVENVRVVLYGVDVPEVEAAVRTIARGEWTAGRRALEHAVRSDAVRALEPSERARVLYDLGQARRFDPSTLTDPERHFRAAEHALRAAIRLDPDRRYRRALAELAAHREGVELVREQQDAAEHNFRVGQGVPEPPPGYLQSPPP